MNYINRKSKVKQSGNRGHENGVQLLLLETVKEDPEVGPPSPRGRSQSEAYVFTCQSYCPPRLGMDKADGMVAGGSLPRLYRRSERRKRLRNTELLEAIKSRNCLEVERLLNLGANPNATCYSDCVTACHLAALVGGEALALLQEKNARMMRMDRLGRTPLHFAAWEGNIVQIAILLNIPKDIQNKITHHISPDVVEEIKAMNGSFHELVNVRVKSGETTQKHPDDWLDTIDHACLKTNTNLPLLQPGWTPLHAASANARPQSVQLLLAAGSDPNVRDFMGRSALDVAGFACYSRQHVNPNNFSEVIKLLIEVNPKNSNINLGRFLNTPLHTAVEVGSIEAMTQLLAAGASPYRLNRDGLTPMHLCVKNQLKEHLQVLLENDHGDSEFVMTPIDALDKDGRTILHTAVLSGWAPGVCVALKAGANISAKGQDGETPIHLAAALGNVEVLSEILRATHSDKSIDCLNTNHETALFKAIENGHIKCVETLLKKGASITVTRPKLFNVFHAAARLGHVKILKLLLDYDYPITRILINYQATDLDDGKGFGPLHYAVWNNYPKCVKLLLSMNAYVSLRTSYGEDMQSTPLHLAAMKNNLEIAKILVKFDSKTVHDTNSLGWTPLHTASRYKSRDVLIYLLSEGANLAAVTNGPDKFTAVDMIMNNLSKPTEFMEEVFDSYIRSNNLNLHDPNCQVTVNYSILHDRSEIGITLNESETEPSESETNKKDRSTINHEIKQTTVIEAIIGTGNRQKQNRLLVHPLVESFLYLKWRALLPFFCVMIVVYSVFVLSLTVVILSTLFYNDRSHHIPSAFNPRAWTWVVSVTIVILIIQEVVNYNFARRYSTQLETWLKLITMLLGLVVVVYRNEGTAPDLHWYRQVATAALLLSWVELMFLLSRFPKWGYYVPMFSKVSSNVIKILLTFGFLFIGFSLSFMIEFHAQVPFENPFAAIVKTMVMMTSEFDYDDLIGNIQKQKGFVPAIPSIRIVLLGFVIFAAIVLMNLMVGVAVNDLQNLELIGNIRRIKKQVDFLAFLENVCDYTHLKKFLPKSTLSRLVVKKEIILRPSEQSCEYYKKLPGHIRDSIFDIAQSQKQYTDDRRGTKCYNKKLDEIHKAFQTIRNDYQLSKTPTIQVDDDKMELLKQRLDMYVEQTRYSIEVLNNKVDSILGKLDRLGQ